MTDKKLELALELKKWIKESDDFLTAQELSDPTDELTTITLTSTRRSASIHIHRFPEAFLALRDAMREEWKKLTKEYEAL